MITSAALYFEPQSLPVLPSQWFAKMVAFFNTYGLHFNEFHLRAPGYADDRIRSLPDEMNSLTEAVGSGQVRSLACYSDSVTDEPGDVWSGAADADCEGGLLFVGIDETIVPHPGSLLLRFLELTGTLINCAYGIGYRFPLHKGPSCYAAGGWVGSLTDLFSNPTEEARLAAWSDERHGARRYLLNRFRGAYPANILSATHVQALHHSVFQGERVPGRLVPLPQAHWYWELAPEDLPSAEEKLRSSGLLIS